MPPTLVSDSLSYLLGHLDFLFLLVGTVFSLLALLFTFDAVAGGTRSRDTADYLSNSVPSGTSSYGVKLIGGLFSVRRSVPCIAVIRGYLYACLARLFRLGRTRNFLHVVLSLICRRSLLYSIGVVSSQLLEHLFLPTWILPKTALIVAFYRLGVLLC